MTTAAALAGRRVLVTRSAEKGGELQRLLTAAGADVVSVPMIETEQLADAAAIRAALARLRGSTGASWAAFGSTTAVRLVAAAAAEDLAGLHCAAVGSATAAALTSLGHRPDLVPAESSASALALDLGPHLLAGSSVLLFAAEGGSFQRTSLPHQPEVAVETLLLYRSVMPGGAAAALTAALPGADAVVFTSGSTVRHAAATLGARRPPPCPAVCIGAPTAEAARACGWTDVVVAAEATPEALLTAIVQRLSAPQPLP